MSTQTVLGARRHGRSDSTGTTVPYHPQPSSPTLTNPDMILPDYDEPEALDHDMHSPLLLWNHNQVADGDFNLGDVLQSGGIQLTTPIIYGNGTMLSDIGEVTEVESNVGGPKRMGSQRSNRSDQDNHHLRASPTMTTKTFIRRAANAPRERRTSVESISTVMSHDRDKERPFLDFDDSVSVDDSNFQGDDEESVAGSFLDDGGGVARNSIIETDVNGQRQSTNEDRYSTSSISRRAEEILANAKRRLNTMEGNLTRARTLSYSSVSDGSTPSPIQRSTSVIRQIPLGASPNHSRNISENNLTTTPRAHAIPQRSASAMGAAGGYRQPLPLSRSENMLVEKSSRLGHGISQHPLDTALEPLSEDEGTSTVGSNRDSAQYGQFGSPTFDPYVDPAGIARSASAAQVRDLHDQMKGLKGKIATLKEQAKADKLKRRSLQSLRTPSPFTHARWDQDYSDKQQPPQSPEPVAAPKLGSPFRPDFPIHDVAGQQQGNMDTEANSRQTKDKEPTVFRHSPVQNLHQAYIHAAAEPQKLEEAGKQEEIAVLATTQPIIPETGEMLEDDVVSESGESTYHETLENPVSHEDREDAFDYQNFFLHSAMGTLSRQGFRRRGSSGTIDSEDSTETTRAAPNPALARRSSIDTLDSVDSFATATEGRSSRVSNAEDPEEEVEAEAEAEETEQEATLVMVADKATHEENDDLYTQDIDEAIARNSAVYDMSGTASGTDDSHSSNEFAKHQRSISYKKIGSISPATRHGLHRPSVSSFESTGTNRSFPLVNKSRLSGTSFTSRDSPDHQVKQYTESPLRDRSNTYESDVANGGQYSPSVVPLSREDQYSVDRLVACFNKCVEGLTDVTETTTMRDKYRRRLEAARRILEGEDELL